MQVHPIRLLVTGGTFDKEYDMIQGQLYFKDTHLPEMFALGRCTLPIHIRTLMMIDSLEMTDSDRQIILHHCSTCTEKHLLITHGTDTMVETAAFLARAELSKTIVLTGAMIPYKFGSSDGFFNLGNALAYAQSLLPGVYVAMNGIAFPWNDVQKNRRTGFFEPLSTPEEV